MEFKNYSKDEVRELVKLIHHGVGVRESVAESQGKSWQTVSALEQKLFQSIYDGGHKDIIKQFEGILLPDDSLLQNVEETQAEYNEEEFWHDLMVQLGKRDFFRSITTEEEQALTEDGWLPERVHEFYQIYDEEFSEYGLERLKITKD
jgi:hypothetical protein